MHTAGAGGKQNPRSSQSVIGALGPLPFGFTQVIPLHPRAPSVRRPTAITNFLEEHTHTHTS